MAHTVCRITSTLTRWVIFDINGDLVKISKPSFGNVGWFFHRNFACVVWTYLCNDFDVRPGGVRNGGDRKISDEDTLTCGKLPYV
jgi:hypothetical protein